jgi:hypothetical protein
MVKGSMGKPLRTGSGSSCRKLGGVAPYPASREFLHYMQIPNYVRLPPGAQVGVQILQLDQIGREL